MPAIDLRVRIAIEIILGDCWNAELEDFRANPEIDHLFRNLVAVDNWLNNTEFTAEYYLTRSD